MDEIVKAMTEMYRRRGYAAPGVPVVAFLEHLDEKRLEESLARLLDDGTVVPYRRGAVALSANLRLAILNEGVLRKWSQQAEGLSKGHKRHLVECIRDEVRILVQHAVDAKSKLPEELLARAAELAAVLVMTDCQPEAMSVVSAHGGAPGWQLSQLRSLEEESLTSLDDLRRALRRLVSTEYAEQRPTGR